MMKNSIKKISFILLFGLFFSVDFVYAANCDAIFTPEAYEFIREILGYVTIVVPILLILLCSMDLASIVISHDDNASKKAISRIIKRFIVGAAFFFIPLIVRFLLGLDPVKTSLNLVDDPTCGIVFDENKTGSDTDS